MTLLARRTLFLIRVLTPALPMAFGLGILLWTGVFVHTYRSSMREAKGVAPAFPRAALPFRIDLPGPTRGTREAATIRVDKERAGPYAQGLWPLHQPVLKMPIFLERNRSRVTIGLRDPGVYRIRVTDTKSGSPLYSRQVRITVPASLLRNELLLMAFLGLSASLSGRIARKILPGKSSKIPKSDFRPLLFWTLIEISVILLFSGLSLPPGSGVSQKIPIPKELLRAHDATDREGILTIRHRIAEPGIADWSRFGEEHLVFSGRVDLDNLEKNGFLLASGGGESTFSLLTPEKSGRGFNLTGTERTIPATSPFPLLLFSGLLVFSGAFFLREL
jgi:hypothetical protein